jgi:hypothetical protein
MMLKPYQQSITVAVITDRFPSTLPYLAALDDPLQGVVDQPQSIAKGYWEGRRGIR